VQVSPVVIEGVSMPPLAKYDLHVVGDVVVAIEEFPDPRSISQVWMLDAALVGVGGR
jgi:hypothetical protein